MTSANILNINFTASILYIYKVLNKIDEAIKSFIWKLLYFNKHNAATYNLRPYTMLSAVQYKLKMIRSEVNHP
ncbi:hypothetical protein D5055_03230 [Acinetobacter radioresistens]|jgi:hypothetical protein|nr:hypothetical protein D5055_03230 [Acinetobacter radioresistens]